MAITLLVVGLRVIPTSARERVTLAHFDLLGAFSSTAALLLLVYAVVQAPSHGWGLAATLGSFAASVVLMAAFVAVERRVAMPLVRLGILRSASVLHANAAGAVMPGWRSWHAPERWPFPPKPAALRAAG